MPCEVMQSTHSYRWDPRDLQFIKITRMSVHWMSLKLARRFIYKQIFIHVQVTSQYCSICETIDRLEVTVRAEVGLLKS